MASGVPQDRDAPAQTASPPLVPHDQGRGECSDCDNGDDLLPLEHCDSCGRSEDYCGEANDG